MTDQLAIASARTASTPAAPAPRTHPKAYLATVSGLKCTLPVAPAEVDLDGYADAFETVDRTGRKPLVYRSGDGLRSMAFELFVCSQTLGRSVQPALHQLASIAATDSPVTFSYGASERGLWRMTRCSITVTERQPYTNDATKAMVRLSFLEASTAAPRVGPLTGGAVRPPAKPKSRTVVHVWRKGDTLAKVALHYYGLVSAGPLMLRANKITNPRRQLVPGRRLTIVPLAATRSSNVRPGGIDLRRASATVKRILAGAGYLGTYLDDSAYVVYPPPGTTGVVRSRITTADASALIKAGFTRRSRDRVDTLYPPASMRAT